jgi:leucine efflux protein
MFGIADPLGYVTIAFLPAGFLALAGCTAGDLCLMLLAALGVAAVLHAYPLAFDIIRWAGAIYLIWLGVKALLHRVTATATENVSALPPTGRSLPRIFFAGLGVILINPKAILFFMAFFPLFIDPATSRGPLTFAVLGGIFVAMNICYLSTVMILGRLLRRHLIGSRGLQQWLTRLAGLAFIGFGLRLALISQRS